MKGGGILDFRKEGILQKGGGVDLEKGPPLPTMVPFTNYAFPIK